MKRIYWLLFITWQCSNGYGQESSITPIQQLNATYQKAIGQSDSIKIFDAATALVAHYNTVANFDSLYHYQDVQIEYFNGYHEIDHYIEALKNNYFMDRRFGRGNIANTRRHQLSPWMDDHRISMKNRCDLAFLVAGYHYGTGHVDSLLVYQRKSIVYADSMPEPHRLQVITRVQMGAYLEDIGRYAEALEYLTEAEPLGEKITYPPILKVQLYKAIAKAMIEINELVRAEEYADKMINIIERNNFSSMNFEKAQIKAKIAGKKGNYEEALANYRKAYKLADKKAKNKPTSTINKINAAAICLKLGDLNAAKSVMDSISAVSDLNTRAQVLLDKLWTDYYLKRDNVKRAAIYLDKVNAYNRGENPYKQSIADLNVRYHQQAGNKDLELKYLREHTRITDSVDQIANISFTKRLEAEFNREKQAIEISALTQTNIEKDKSLTIRNALIWVGGISLLILSALLFWLYRLLKKDRENQKQLTAQNKQISQSLGTNQLLLKEIHHRVKNNLQVISSLLSMQARKSVDKTTKDALQSSKSRVQSMSILHQSLYKNDTPTKVDVNSYFLEIIDNIRDTYQTDIPIAIDMDIAHLMLDVDTLVPLGLIVNELITNSYKHAFIGQAAGKIQVEFKPGPDEELITLKVSDNGIGLPGAELTSRDGSLGNKLIKEFARSLGGKITIKSNDKGASIRITFTMEDLKDMGSEFQ